MYNSIHTNLKHGVTNKVKSDEAIAIDIVKTNIAKMLKVHKCWLAINASNNNQGLFITILPTSSGENFNDFNSIHQAI